MRRVHLKPKNKSASIKLSPNSDWRWVEVTQEFEFQIHEGIQNCLAISIDVQFIFAKYYIIDIQ